jgi:hypothetical protein
LNLAARAVPTLCVVAGGSDGTDLHWLVPLDVGQVRHIEALQEQSREAGPRGRKSEVLLADQLLAVHPTPARIGPILLANGSMAVVLNPKPLKNMPTVMIELKAQFVHQVGLLEAADSAQRVLYELAAENASDEQLKSRVTRIDLFVDVQGWAPAMNQVIPRRFAEQAGIEGAVNDALYTRARKCKPYLGLRFTGVDIGTKGSGISAGFYNKTVEIEEASGKTWFEEIWKKSGNYTEGKDVWRSSSVSSAKASPSS